MLLIARRYLLSPKSHSVVNIIAGISLISLLIPVAAVIILLSIFNGFGAMVEGSEGAMEGDLTARLRDGKLFDISEIDTTRLRTIEGVEGFSFATEQSVMLEHRDLNCVLTLRGVDDEYTNSTPIRDYLYWGDFISQTEALEEIVIGSGVSSKLGIRGVRSVEIDIHSLRTGKLESIVSAGSHTSAKASLSGVVILGSESDDRYAYASQRLVNRLIGREGVASRLAIKSDNSGNTRAKIEALLGDRFKVESRAELNPTIYQLIRYEKMGVLLICSFVILLASFSLLGALTMLIIERRDDIKTLRAMGATRYGVERIFLIEGALISGVAIASGVVLGVAVTLLQQYFGFVELPSSSMVVTPYPVELRLWDVVVVIAIASAIALIIDMVVVKTMLRREDSKK